MAEGESDGDSLGFSVCVLAVSSSVAAVTVLVMPVSPPDVSVFGEVVLSDSEWEIVNRQTI